MKISNEKLLIALANEGMLLKDLAEKAGISMEALRNIRKGISVPKPATVGRIAKALNVNVQEIIVEG